MATISFSTTFQIAGGGNILFEDTSDYAGQSILTTSVNGCFKITSPSGIVIYNNTDFSNANCDIWVDNDVESQQPITPPLAINGLPELGVYTIIYKVYDSVALTYYTITNTYTNRYVRPVISIQQTVDCLSPMFTSLDATNYVVGAITPTVTRTHTIDFPFGTAGEGNPVIGSAATVTTSTFYPGTQTTEISSILEYTFSDGLIITDTLAGSKEVVVDCKDVCGVYCCVRSLEQQMVSPSVMGNPSEYARVTSLFSQIMGLVSLALMAIRCGKSGDVNGYLTTLKLLAHCTDDCNSCGDNTAQVVGLGGLINEVVVISGSPSFITVTPIVVGNTKTYTVTLSDSIINNVNKVWTQTFANDAARAAAVPDFVGQLGLQIDTNTIYSATALTAGSWYQDTFFQKGAGNASIMTKNAVGAAGAISIAIGDIASSPGSTSIAIGFDAISSGLVSIAIGGDALSSGDNTVAIGNGTHAAGNASTAMGNASSGSGNSSVALGNTVVTSATNTVGVGTSITASATNAIGIGSTVTASGTHSIGIGNTVTASGSSATAIGRLTVASSTNSVALGNVATSTAVSSLAIGTATSSTGGSSIALGTSASATNTSAMALGVSSSSTAINSSAIGGSASATAADSLAIGSSSVSSASGSTAIGKSSAASQTSALAIGVSSVASAATSIAIGASASGSGISAVALGNSSVASSQDSIAIGHSASASDQANIAIGTSAVASGSVSLSIGNGATASGSGSNAIGDLAIARIDYTTVITGAIITRKDTGQDPANLFSSGALVTITSEEVDLKVVAEITTIAIPSGAIFFPDEVDLILTTSTNNVTGQPTVRAGGDVSTASLLAAVATTALTLPNHRQRFSTLLTSTGQQTLTAGVTVGATGTTVKGRFIFSGRLIEIE